MVVFLLSDVKNTIFKEISYLNLSADLTSFSSASIARLARKKRMTEAMGKNNPAIKLEENGVAAK